MIKNSVLLITSCLILSSQVSGAKESVPKKRIVASSGKTIQCGSVQVDVPAKLGDLPNLDFDVPVNVTHFSFRDGNLSMVAMDQNDATRLRLVISAQYNSKSKTYSGQIFTDLGGNQMQVDNGPVTCSAK